LLLLLLYGGIEVAAFFLVLEMKVLEPDKFLAASGRGNQGRTIPRYNIPAGPFERGTMAALLRKEGANSRAFFTLLLDEGVSQGMDAGVEAAFSNSSDHLSQAVLFIRIIAVGLVYVKVTELAHGLVAHALLAAVVFLVVLILY